MTASTLNSLPPKCAQLVIEQVRGKSVAVTAEAGYPSKLITFTVSSGCAWTYMVTYGGGLVAGDRIDLNMVVKESATALLTTQGSTKVYKNGSPMHSRITTTQTTYLQVLERAVAIIIPDPVVCFRHATFSQKTIVNMTKSASLLLVDWLISGRSACGERWCFDSFETHVDVDVEGVPVLRDRVVLLNDEPSSNPLAVRMKDFDAIATVVVIGPNVQNVMDHATRSVEDDIIRGRRRRNVICSSSLIRESTQDGVLLRIAGRSGQVVRDKVRQLLQPLSDLIQEDFWSRKL